MKIGIVTGIFPPDIGGPAAYVPKMATALQARGHRVRVLCLSDSLSSSEGTYPFPVLRILRGIPLPFRVLRVLLECWKVSRWADIVYVNGLRIEAAVAAKLARKPVLHKVVGDFAWERARHRGWYTGTIDAYQTDSKNLRLRFLDIVSRFPFRLGGKVVVPSRYLSGIVAGTGVSRDRIRVVYNAVEPVEIAPVPEREAKLVTVCRLVSWKGVDGLLRVLRALPGLRLEIAGDGPDRGKLEALTRDLGLEARVSFHGSLPSPEVRRLLRSAKIFVLNSTYEGLPHVVLEAMQEGTPVIATDVGGTSEVVRHEETGLLVPAGDDAALERAVRRLLEDSALSARLAARGEALIGSDFAYATMVAETERALVSAARQPKQPVRKQVME